MPHRKQALLAQTLRPRLLNLLAVTTPEESQLSSKLEPINTQSCKSLHYHVFRTKQDGPSFFFFFLPLKDFLAEVWFPSFMLAVISQMQTFYHRSLQSTAWMLRPKIEVTKKKMIRIFAFPGTKVFLQTFRNHPFCGALSITPTGLYLANVNCRDIQVSWPGSWRSHGHRFRNRDHMTPL